MRGRFALSLGLAGFSLLAGTRPARAATCPFDTGCAAADPRVVPRAQSERASVPGASNASDELAGRFACFLHMGLATPYGATGITFDTLPFEWLGIEVGFGTNLIGAEVGVMPRLRLPLGRRVFLTAGVGWSMGPYVAMRDLNGVAGYFRVIEAINGPDYGTKVWMDANWANFELGFEVRPSRHAAVRPYVGYARILNPSDYTCHMPEGSEGADPCMPGEGNGLVYAGAAIGYVF